jgi:hypothetical protein
MSLFRPDASIFPCTSASAELCGLPRWGLLTGILTLRETATASRQPQAAGQRR